MLRHSMRIVAAIEAFYVDIDLKALFSMHSLSFHDHVWTQILNT